MKLPFLAVFLGIFLGASLFSQNHVSVHLDNQIYYILEQAEVRGLCSPLSGSRPYTRNVITKAINEILNADNAGTLRAAEREILEQYLARFAKPKAGLDWRRGGWYDENPIGESDILFSVNAGVSADIEGSAGIYPAFNEHYLGTEIWAHAYLNGDIGRYISYGFIFEGGLIQAPRKLLGEGNTYYVGFEDSADGEFVNQTTTVYSSPMSHFPYSYKKRWDGSVYFFDDLSMYRYWPETVGGAYNLPVELTGSFLDDRFIMRLGRISHEWGTAPLGSSLAFNKMARPFASIEAEFNPVSWFGISSLFGALEYYNVNGIYDSPKSFQNFFSITMLQFKYKEYLFLDFIDAAIWPKRFEIGYMAPIINNFFYQNNVGKFDNMAITMTLKAQYPGLGSIWGSVFVDEMNINSKMFELDRTMIAIQAGLNMPLPFLAFSSVKFTYTKINPYTYTHHRNILPWYGDMPMEKNYASNGVCLGYYLPPNSDEFLINFRTAPVKNIFTNFQYQMIRHGASYGPNEVHGSSLVSELDPGGRSTKDILRRYFLRDGAYQWMHIFKLGAEWNLAKVPVTFFGETGTVISYFTNIKEPAKVTGEPHPYSIIDTPDYPKSTGFIVTLGVRIFTR
ncbi:MAG: hypothetical protein FWD36_01050 [Treponema sp.]|nr:hypothetical protein [Treponema sp.]